MHINIHKPKHFKGLIQGPMSHATRDVSPNGRWARVSLKGGSWSSSESVSIAACKVGDVMVEDMASRSIMEGLQAVP